MLDIKITVTNVHHVGYRYFECIFDLRFHTNKLADELTPKLSHKKKSFNQTLRSFFQDVHPF